MGGNVPEDRLPTEPGEWKLEHISNSDGTSGPHYFFGCPLRPGHLCGVPVVPSPPNAKGCAWTWDGNGERPTLSPSVDCRTEDGGCGFHKTLVAGEWK